MRQSLTDTHYLLRTHQCSWIVNVVYGNHKYFIDMKTGDNVLISPEVTHKSGWTQGTVIDVEDNSFVGTVISAQTAEGEIFFDKAFRFKPSI